MSQRDATRRGAAREAGRACQVDALASIGELEQRRASAARCGGGSYDGRSRRARRWRVRACASWCRPFALARDAPRFRLTHALPFLRHWPHRAHAQACHAAACRTPATRAPASRTGRATAHERSSERSREQSDERLRALRGHAAPGDTAPCRKARRPQTDTPSAPRGRERGRERGRAAPVEPKRMVPPSRHGRAARVTDALVIALRFGRQVHQRETRKRRCDCNGRDHKRPNTFALVLTLAFALAPALSLVREIKIEIEIEIAIAIEIAVEVEIEIRSREKRLKATTRE